MTNGPTVTSKAPSVR
ncbi:hypothetical protein YPPY04_3678, partial [Yersinia pestis PY-04]